MTCKIILNVSRKIYILKFFTFFNRKYTIVIALYCRLQEKNKVYKKTSDTRERNGKPHQDSCF